MRILSLTLGSRHNDWKESKSAMKTLGMEVVSLNLAEETIDSIDPCSFDMVELRHCRGWQLQWAEFSKLLAKLQKMGLLMVNPPSMFQWVVSKSSYLLELEGRGVRIVPTAVVRSGDVVTLQNYLDKSKNQSVVIKPDHGARAVDVQFVQIVGHDTFKVVEPHKTENSTCIINSLQLEERFAVYRDQAHREKILVQDYLPEGREISAILIEGKFRFVETTKSSRPDALVAHDEYGGLNIPLPSVNPTLEAFVKQVVEAMPEDVRDSPYIRIDTIQSGNQIYLLEIEGGTPRLFLKETARAREYAIMLKHQASFTRMQPKRRIPIRIAIVGGGLAGVGLLSSLVQAAASIKLSSLKIEIFERAEEIGSGLPYALSAPDTFLLNHEADYMGSVNLHLQHMDCTDFASWVRSNLETLSPLYPNTKLDTKSGYLPRSLYGRYLIARYEETKAFPRGIVLRLPSPSLKSLTYGRLSKDWRSKLAA